MRKALSIFLSLLLTIVGFQNSTHEHKDHQIHLDCSLCVLQNSHQEVKDTKLEYKHAFIVIVFLKKEKEENYPKLIYTIKPSARSPPVV